MILSRNWLNEFVDLKDITDKEFNDEMTLSGSKVETIERPDENLKNVVVGKILEMKRHENSDHMWVCQIDVGQAEPVQIVTGAWNIHVGDYVPAALHGAHLPGGVKIEKGKLRGVESNGMLCSLKELGMTAEHDFPYAVITPAALLNDYHPIDPAKPSIPADIKPGDKVYGPVLCGRVEAVKSTDGGYDVRVNDGTVTRAAKTACSNLHEGDLVAYNTKSDTICTLEDLHAEQKEFPHCIPDGIFVLHEEGIQNGDDIKPVIGADDEEIAQAISVIFLFNVIAALIFPTLGGALGLSNEGFGLFAGTAVNDTSSVTAAAAAWDGMHPGANTLDTAAIVKMTRTLAIIPITLVLALLRTRREGKQGGAQVDIKKIFPWFVLLFLVASIITTLLPIPAGLVSFLKSASKFFIVMAMVAIGLNTDIVKLVKTGGKPIFMGFCCWVAIACVSLLVQHLLGIW